LDPTSNTILNPLLASKTSVPSYVRRLWPSDRAAYEAHLLGLDEEGRTMRFAGTISDERIVVYGRLILDPRRVLHGFFQGASCAAPRNSFPPGTESSLPKRPSRSTRPIAAGAWGMS